MHPDRSKLPTIYDRYARTWGFLTVGGAVIIGGALIATGTLASLTDLWRSVMLGVGESIVASVLLYVLVSLFLDPKRQHSQMRHLIEYVTTETSAQFQSRFAISLPTEAFESSDVPHRSFSVAFIGHLSSSSRYDYMGVTADFTSFRLDMNMRSPEIQALSEVRLSILNPSSDFATRAHAELRLRQRKETWDDRALSDEITLIKKEIYTSLYTLFQIRNNRSTTVYLHDSLPFFRCELFDSGIFLTYYLGRRSFPETLEFAANTRPYQAYSSAMDLARKYSSRAVVFGDSGPWADLVPTEAALLALLQSLGCQYSIAELADTRKARTSTLTDRLRAVGLDTSRPF